MLTTILITVLLTILTLIIGAIVTVIILAPMRIQIRFEQRKAYEFDFGHYMKNMWSGLHWFTITEVFFNEEGQKGLEVNYADMLYSAFEANQATIDKINKKVEKDQMEKLLNEYEPYEPEYEEILHLLILDLNT